jgi:uncharacterized protein
MDLPVFRQAMVRARELQDSGFSVDLIFHGGEPLILPVPYLTALTDEVHAVLDKSKQFKIRVQTNGYRMTSDHLRWLVSNKVGVGISLDGIGSERVTGGGEETQDAALESLKRMRNAGLSVGAVCVLGRHNKARLTNLLDFFRGLNLPVRLSPIHKDSTEDQNIERRLTAAEVLSFFKRAFDHSAASNTVSRVQPIRTVTAQAAAYLGIRPIISKQRYDPFQSPKVIVIEPTGQIFGHRDDPSNADSHGDVFANSLFDRHLTPGGNASRSEILRLQKTVCVKCKYFGACDGRYIAEATSPELKSTDGNCAIYAPLIAHVVDRLRIVSNDVRGRMLETANA